MADASAAAVESPEQLREKLATYNAQLSQVEQLLQADPQNAEFLKLKQDLLEVVALTNDLVMLSLIFR